MPINPFQGDTFVAFIDISGFKEKMKNRDHAREALSTFYQTAYSVLMNHGHDSTGMSVEGLFISDCGILFSRYNEENYSNNRIVLNELGLLLKTIERICKELIHYDIMLTASIAFGQFNFENRTEFVGIEKTLMFGNAYLNAFLDTETGKPKVEPGQCRILLESLDDSTKNNISNTYTPPFDRVIKRPPDKKHLYFYWMLNDHNRLAEFEGDYKDTFKRKYTGMIEVLKHYSRSQ